MKITILIIYALILLIIGIYSALKAKSPKEYFIAGKQSGLIPITGSLLATILGGSAILGTINLAQKQSWAAIWYILAASIGLFFLIPIVKKVNRFGKYTLPELIGRFYGEQSRKTASIIIPVAWLGIVAAQIIAAAQIMFSFFGLDYSSGVILASVVFILYTFLGGQISILKTDFIQSFIIIVGILITFIILISKPESNQITGSFSIPFNSNFSLVDLIVLILTFSSTFVVGPDIYSRVFCAKDEKTSKRSVLISAIILIPFAFILSYLGVFAVGAGHQMEGTSLLVNIINTYLPEWMTGIMIAALLSAVLSSADTTLLTGAMIMSELFNSNIDSKEGFRQTRLHIVIIGLLSMVIALKVSSIIASLLLALSFYSGAFIIPMIFALFNLPYSKKYSLVAMISGGIIALSGKILVSIYEMDFGNWIIISAFLVNALLLIIPYRKSY